MRDHVKSLLIVAAIFSFSLFVIGYAQNVFLIQLVVDLVYAIGFGPKSVGEFLFGWFIVALPNILCVWWSGGLCRGIGSYIFRRCSFFSFWGQRFSLHAIEGVYLGR